VSAPILTATSSITLAIGFFYQRVHVIKCFVCV
jgi:hypothetical protein